MPISINMESAQANRQSGLFVTLEGGEGSGKSTAQGLVAEILRDSGRTVVETNEPGASSIGPLVRGIVLDERESPLSTQSEALLLLASRAQHVDEVIIPALDQGCIVLCDRFVDSTLAYQGIGRGLPVDMLKQASLFASQGLEPDVTFLFDLDPQVGLPRRFSAGGLNRLDREEMDFHRVVRSAYLDLAERDRARFVVLDATRSPSELARVASQEIFRRIHLRESE